MTLKAPVIPDTATRAPHISRRRRDTAQAANMLALCRSWSVEPRWWELYLVTLYFLGT